MTQFLQSSVDDQVHLQTLDQYVTAHPDDGNAAAVRCAVEHRVAMNQRQSLADAIEDCRKAVALAPQSSLTHLTLADALYDSGQIAASLPEYSSAIDLGETRFGIFWRRCDANRRTGNLDAALSDCNRQVQLTPALFQAVYARGVLYVFRKDYPNAIVDLTAAISEKGDDINALYWRGLAYLGIGNAANAEVAFTTCITLGDRAPDTIYYRGLARRALGKTSDAISDLTQAVNEYQAAGMTEQANRAKQVLSQLNAPI